MAEIIPTLQTRQVRLMKVGLLRGLRPQRHLPRPGFQPLWEHSLLGKAA